MFAKVPVHFKVPLHDKKGPLKITISCLDQVDITLYASFTDKFPRKAHHDFFRSGNLKTLIFKPKSDNRLDEYSFGKHTHFFMRLEIDEKF
jgi:hypothetical protein